MVAISMKNLSEQVLDAFESCSTDSCVEVTNNSTSIPTLIDNLVKIEQFTHKKKYDRALFFAQMVAEDMVKLIDDLKNKEVTK